MTNLPGKWVLKEPLSVEPRILINNKDKSTIAESDINKLAASSHAEPRDVVPYLKEYPV